MNKLIKIILYVISYIALCTPLVLYCYVSMDLFRDGKDSYFFSIIYFIIITFALWLFYGWLESITIKSKK